MLCGSGVAACPAVLEAATRLWIHLEMIAEV
jgi:hypothetical protein